MSKVIRLALDGNEANVNQRVGSNVYGFKVLEELYKLTKNEDKYHCTVLLANKPVADMPAVRNNWQYEVVTPSKLWTQWALPLHLFWYQRLYDVFFTPSHYAARLSAVPYVNTIHDLAFLDYPQQFNKNDLFKLKNWTKYSVNRATKVIAVSNFSKQQTHDAYRKSLADIVVASPAVAMINKYSPLRFSSWLRKHGINKNGYFLYLGTIQPRKNLENLVEAYEKFTRFYAANELKRKNGNTTSKPMPQLVLAGKVGWLAEGIQKRIADSPAKEHIVLAGFVDEELKKPLYEQAIATILIELQGGFGIPPLESLSVGTPAIVSNLSSFPEVIGDAGWQVDPNSTPEIAEALRETWGLSPSKRKEYAQKAKRQAKKFSWQTTAKTILKTLAEIARS